jgi:hypothetical protein
MGVLCRGTELYYAFRHKKYPLTRPPRKAAHARIPRSAVPMAVKGQPEWPDEPHLASDREIELAWMQITAPEKQWASRVIAAAVAPHNAPPQASSPLSARLASAPLELDSPALAPQAPTLPDLDAHSARPSLVARENEHPALTQVLALHHALLVALSSGAGLSDLLAADFELFGDNTRAPAVPTALPAPPALPVPPTLPASGAAGVSVSSVASISGRLVGDDLVLVTTVSPGAASRATLWRRSSGGWLCVFHQV